jgi:hypothetical protein
MTSVFGQMEDDLNVKENGKWKMENGKWKMENGRQPK